MGHNQSSSPASWPPANNTAPLATFAGGCFWGVELAYQRQPGVLSTCVGYTNGQADNVTYEMVCSGTTGYTEAVQMTYDPEQVSYQRLCELLISRIDPRAKNRQGNDVGTQYRSGIYTHDEEQAKIAQAIVDKIDGCAVEVVPVEKFSPAEEYHQQYLEKGGRAGRGQSAKKGCSDPIRCYG
ncbi:hypothetical protein BSKO_14044 [Bryopsis sp. KO-2023]|nr:hypothetical protein BSKO_14044 [Bryopsis sp. KO-2023]